MLATFSDRLFAELPPVFFDDSVDDIRKNITSLLDEGITEFLCGSFSGAELLRETFDKYSKKADISESQLSSIHIHADYSFNITNHTSAVMYDEMGFSSFTLSFEQSAKNVRDMVEKLGDIGDSNDGEVSGLKENHYGIISYGKLPLMKLRNRQDGEVRIKDRKDFAFPLKKVGSITTLYNHLPLYVMDKLESFSDIDFVTFYFTNESSEQVIDILEIGSGEEPLKTEYTRGVYFKKS
jgi:hypothetical protein